MCLRKKLEGKRKNTFFSQMKQKTDGLDTAVQDCHFFIGFK